MYCKRCPSLVCCCCRDCEPTMSREEQIEETRCSLGYIKTVIEDARLEWGLDIETVVDLALEIAEECR